MIRHSLRAAFALGTVLLVTSACNVHVDSSHHHEHKTTTKAPPMSIHYLEIVTPEVDATCKTLGALHGVTFSEPDMGMGAARIATLPSGGRIGVRAPMADHEEPVIRPYHLVEDIEAALEDARKAGAEIAMTATPVPGHGAFAIYFLGGIQHGLWQLD